MKLKMKYLTIALINIAFIFSGFICAKSTSGSDNTPLPEKRPDNITFSYSQSGGMMYYSENIYISKDSCFYKINDGGAISRVDFKLSDSELDKLYAVFRDNRFDEIDTFEEKVFDRGGESIYLSWKPGKYAKISNSGMSFVQSSWSKEWNNCVNAIEKIGKDEMEKQLKNYEIIFDKSLYGKELYMQINRDIVFKKGKLISEISSDDNFVKIVKLSPGYHNASVTVDKSYNTFKINSDSTKSLRLYMVNDSLKHEFTIKN